MKIVLIQPPYPHGGSGKRQTYLPGGLMNLGSRLLGAGAEVEFLDLNQTTWQSCWQVLVRMEFIGFSVLGAPYIPVVLSIIKEMRMAGLNQRILIGGEGVARIQAEDFEAWFGRYGALLVRNDRDLAKICGLREYKLASMYETSMVPMLRRLPSELLHAYLANEFALFTSQGCAFLCTFCAADKGKKEQYRSTETLVEEVEFICKALSERGVRQFSAYLTNLDAFQTPGKLEAVMRAVSDVALRYSITPFIRCLATSCWTYRACRDDTGFALRLRSYGLQVVAFGVDGADEEVWRSQNKRHNSLSEVAGACHALEEAGISVELLMVIGFPGSAGEALWQGVRFSLVEAWKGRVIRPYLAKAYSPSGEWPRESELVQKFLSNPELLLRLDYAMLGSKETHPYFFERWCANAAYLTIIGVLVMFGYCATFSLLPVPRGWGRKIAEWINATMPFDK